MLAWQVAMALARSLLPQKAPNTEVKLSHPSLLLAGADRGSTDRSHGLVLQDPSMTALADTGKETSIKFSCWKQVGGAHEANLSTRRRALDKQVAAA